MLPSKREQQRMAEEVAAKPAIFPDEGSPRCITEGCGKERQWKGLCRSCYGQARGLIDKEQTSWDELEAMGLIIQDDKPFVAAFKRKRKEKQEKEEKDSTPPPSGLDSGPNSVTACH